eukprot:9083069-Alexandrium_andersonii.AAC.1
MCSVHAAWGSGMSAVSGICRTPRGHLVELRNGRIPRPFARLVSWASGPALGSDRWCSQLAASAT